MYALNFFNGGKCVTPRVVGKEIDILRYLLTDLYADNNFRIIISFKMIVVNNLPDIYVYL